MFETDLIVFRKCKLSSIFNFFRGKGGEWPQFSCLFAFPFTDYGSSGYILYFHFIQVHLPYWWIPNFTTKLANFVFQITLWETNEIIKAANFKFKIKIYFCQTSLPPPPFEHCTNMNKILKVTIKFKKSIQNNPEKARTYFL